MTDKISQPFEGISETLLMTLYARARESQRPDAMIKDNQAVELVHQIAGDFSRFKMQRHDEIAVIMRMKKFDSYTRSFLDHHPNGVVVHIGCGLDTRFERVDNGQVIWFDLDLPEVIKLRQKLIGNENPRYHTLAASVFDERWMNQMRQYQSTSFLFLAEGVFPYFEEICVKNLFLQLREIFPGSELVCDAHTPFVIWADNLQLAYAKVKARLHWSIKNGREVESWGEGIRLLEEWNYFEDDEPKLKPYHWARHIPAIAKSSGIFHYQLGFKEGSSK